MRIVHLCGLFLADDGVPQPDDPVGGAGPLPPDDGDEASARAFRDRFGEELRQALDVEAWPTGWDLAREYPRIEREVHEAVSAFRDTREPRCQLVAIERAVEKSCRVRQHIGQRVELIFHERD